MAQPSGAKMVGPCPYCGERYYLTNYMKRQHHGIRDRAGNHIGDTHRIACARSHGEITPEQARKARYG